MKTFKILSVLASLVVLSACGSNSTRDTTIGSSGLSAANPTPTPGFVNNNNNSNPYNLPQAQERVVDISGSNGPQPAQSYSVNTSYTLKVKVTALAAPHLTIPGYTNWVFPYACMRVRVTVNGTVQATQLLKVADVPQAQNSPCANSPSSQILDFSNAMTGAGSVTVTINNAEYDNCRYSNPMTYGCGMSAVWQNHMVAANVAIQNDGTYLAP